MHPDQVHCSQLTPFTSQVNSGFDHIFGHFGLIRFRFAGQCKRFCGAGGDAQAATDTPVYIQNHLFVLQPEGIHLATFFADTTAIAALRFGRGHKGTGNQAGRVRLLSDVPEHSAAATAAAANIHNFLAIARLQHQSGLVGFFEDIQNLLLLNKPAKSVVLIVVCSESENKAGFLRLITPLACHGAFPPADAGGHQSLLLIPNQFLCHLIRHHLQPGGQAASYRDRAELGGLLPNVGIKERRNILVHVPDKLRIQIVHMILPYSDDILGGHIRWLAIL